MNKYRLWGKADIKYTWDIMDEVIEAPTLDKAIEALLSRLNESLAYRDDECNRLYWEKLPEEGS